MNLYFCRVRVNHCLLLVIVLSTNCLILLGCNKSPQRVVVTGVVKYQEKLLEHGAISFLPAASTQGVSVVVAPIADGKYTVDKQGGLPLGDYNVSIVEVYLAKVERTASGERPSLSKQKQRIPAKYNDRTELTANITADANPIVLDYVLD